MQIIKGRAVTAESCKDSIGKVVMQPVRETALHSRSLGKGNIWQAGATCCQSMLCAT